MGPVQLTKRIKMLWIEINFLCLIFTAIPLGLEELKQKNTKQNLMNY